MNKLFFAFGLLLLVSCSSEKEQQINSPSYSKAQLLNNTFNVVQLPVDSNFNYSAVLDELQSMKTEDLNKALIEKGNSLQRTSYIIHYLGNRAFEQDKFQEGLQLHHIAADQYLNPWSMVRLAFMYHLPSQQITQSLPKGTDIGDFQRDLPKAYFYINTAMEIVSKISQDNKLHALVPPIKDKSLFLLESLKSSKMQQKYDIAQAAKTVSDTITQIMDRHQKMYDIAIK